MSRQQQQALRCGLVRKVLLGRNEGGIDRWHDWLKRILKTDENELNALFAEGLPRS